VTETVQYTYDALNRRVSETVTVGGVATSEWFVYDGQQLVLELNSGGAVAERYLPGPAVDQVFEHLRGLTNLESLWPGEGVSGAGLSRLHKALPNCRMEVEPEKWTPGEAR
jgi:hypothetical protein